MELRPPDVLRLVDEGEAKLMLSKSAWVLEEIIDNPDLSPQLKVFATRSQAEVLGQLRAYGRRHGRTAR